MALATIPLFLETRRQRDFEQQSRLPVHEWTGWDARPKGFSLNDGRKARIKVAGYGYRILVGPVPHYIFSDTRLCTCGQRDCEGKQVLENYLMMGDVLKAPYAPPGHYPHVPLCCPVCGDVVKADSRWDSLARGKGWACLSGGSEHYWRAIGAARANEECLRCTCDVYPFPHLKGCGNCQCQ